MFCTPYREDRAWLLRRGHFSSCVERLRSSLVLVVCVWSSAFRLKSQRLFVVDCKEEESAQKCRWNWEIWSAKFGRARQRRRNGRSLQRSRQWSVQPFERNKSIIDTEMWPSFFSCTCLVSFHRINYASVSKHFASVAPQKETIFVFKIVVQLEIVSFLYSFCRIIFTPISFYRLSDTLWSAGMFEAHCIAPFSWKAYWISWNDAATFGTSRCTHACN